MSRALSLVGDLLLSYSATRQSLRAENSKEVAHHWPHLLPPQLQHRLQWKASHRGSILIHTVLNPPHINHARPMRQQRAADIKSHQQPRAAPSPCHASTACNLRHVVLLLAHSKATASSAQGQMACPDGALLSKPAGAAWSWGAPCNTRSANRQAGSKQRKV